MRIQVAILILALTLGGKLNAQSNITKETHLYSIHQSDSLFLDKYEVPSDDRERLCIIFAFGGGFFSGARDSEQYQLFFNEMAEEGYVVVSIDYRLGLKDLDMSKISSPFDIVPLLKKTINNTVEDLYDATKFILEHADNWNINPKRILAVGSSAGAITTLQAEYDLTNRRKLSKQLPNDFRYAGIISFAGAILSLEGKLEWTDKPAPILLFHGDADGNVPYDKLELFSIGLYGSKNIAEQLEKLNYPHYFYDIENRGHAVAEFPMTNNLLEIKSFIKDSVIDSKALIIHSKARDKSLPKMKKDHTIIDYIINNFS